MLEACDGNMVESFKGVSTRYLSRGHGWLSLDLTFFGGVGLGKEKRWAPALIGCGDDSEAPVKKTSVP